MAITTTYDYNDGVNRKSLRQQFHHTASMIGPIPWLIGDDFNIFVVLQESFDFDTLGQYSSSEMIDFQDCLSALALSNHLYYGPLFTWTNKSLPECSSASESDSS
ncbi:hypothetical protein V6N11_082493 [Hibiscus sabdariffa]|uniref:Uncharacterized protein n=1 Tax=Hibiscus sabdariffa TaxID=183260 RepID=A0ABR2PCR8_9ROSI